MGAFEVYGRMRPKHIWVGYWLVLFGTLFSVGLTAVDLFDLDELYFAEITREMMDSGTYSQVRFHFEPLYEKPPLFFWMQAASMHVWGINAWGARFPNLIGGLLTLLTLYGIGKRYANKNFGILWMFLHFGAFLPHFYVKSGIIDPWFNYFLLCSIWFLVRARSASPLLPCLGAGICIGLALLTKGPMALVIPCASMLLANGLGRYPLKIKPMLGSSLCACFVAALWLLPEIKQHGWTFVDKFLEYHLVLYACFTDTHTHPWYYHCVVLFWGCFPSSLFAIAYFIQNSWRPSSYFVAAMQALFCVVLVLFTAVGTKIVHYSSMAYFPITFFAARLFQGAVDYNMKISLFIRFCWLFCGLVVGSFLLFFPWIMHHKELWIGCVKHDNVAYALTLPISWTCWDGIPGMVYLVGLGISFAFFIRKHWLAFVWTSMGTQAGALTLFLLQVGPKIQQYVQKDMVDFCKELRHKDVYLTTIGFKAAAPLFYTHRTAATCLKEKDTSWLLTGAIDKPCFFIAYKSDEGFFEPYTDVVRIREAGCFVFYQRSPTHVASV